MGGSPYRRVMDPRRLMPYSPASSGHSSPECGSREGHRTRSRSLSPQGRFSPYQVVHIPLHMRHTAVDSDISSLASESRKSLVDGTNQSDYLMAMEALRRREEAEPNGQNGRTGDWRNERERLMKEILECQRRIQVMRGEAAVAVATSTPFFPLLCSSSVFLHSFISLLPYYPCLPPSLPPPPFPPFLFLFLPQTLIIPLPPFLPPSLPPSLRPSPKKPWNGSSLSRDMIRR